MILNDECFDEIPEIYGAFPLKKDFLAAGNANLEPLGLKAVMEEDVIRIPYLSRLCYSEEDLEYFRSNMVEEDLIEEMSEWLLKGEALIWTGDDASVSVSEAAIDLWGDGPEDEEEMGELQDLITLEEIGQAKKIIEKFLDAAVDLGE